MFGIKRSRRPFDIPTAPRSPAVQPVPAFHICPPAPQPTAQDAQIPAPIAAMAPSALARLEAEISASQPAVRASRKRLCSAEDALRLMAANDGATGEPWIDDQAGDAVLIRGPLSIRERDALIKLVLSEGMAFTPGAWETLTKMAGAIIDTQRLVLIYELHRIATMEWAWSVYQEIEEKKQADTAKEQDQCGA